jgi:Concanavalin A-like lectin/glucanases superfamily
MTSDPTLLRLLAAWLDGDASEAERSELLSQLDSNPNLRRDFAEQIAMIGALAATSEPEPRWLQLFKDLGETQGDHSPLDDFEAHAMARIEEAAVGTKQGKILRLITLGIAAAILVLISLQASRPSPQPPAAVNLDGVAEKLSAVAIVTGSEGRAGADASLNDGTFLLSGTIEQEQGWLGIQTLGGVSITLTAPFRVSIISPQRVYLERGQARVHVPEGAEGFVMESRAFEVLDLGTEFAAHVNADGTGSCRVFEGKADVSFLDGLRQSSATRRVNAGEAVSISPSERRISPAPDDAGSYSQMRIPAKPLLALRHGYAADVLFLGPTDYWRFEGIEERIIANEIPGRPDIEAFGDVTIDQEAGENRSGRLKYDPNNGAFSIPAPENNPLAGDFTIAMFVQLDWLQNYTLCASSRWSESPQKPRGNQLIFKAYASFEQSGLRGTGLYAVFRDKPAWDGGTEIFGNRLMRPKFWHHVALSRSADQVTLHLDGKPVARQTIPSIPIDFDHLYIGHSDSPNRPPEFLERGLIGNVDELVIFDRDLSEGEIAILASGKRYAKGGRPPVSRRLSTTSCRRTMRGCRKKCEIFVRSTGRSANPT